LKAIHINKIGVEIEGGWNERPMFEGRRTTVHGDGSVHSESRLVGEVNSKPFVSRTGIKKWIKQNYPEDINKSMGMHIHISVRTDDDYRKLMTKKFYRTFLKNVKEWGNEMKINEGSAFWVRLEGKNNWCKPLWTKTGLFRKSTIRSQYLATDKGGPRYYIFNFCKRYHGTVECRLFPTFQKEALAESAIDFFYNFCENYLEKVKNDKVPSLKKIAKHTVRMIREQEIRDRYGWLHQEGCSCEFENLIAISICGKCRNYGVRKTCSTMTPFSCA